MVWEGHSRLVNSAYLCSRLQHGPEWKQDPAGRAQEVWPEADGQVTGGHWAGGDVAANVLEQREQPLEEEESGRRQLLGHPEGRATER